jgi:hypothetical protein
MHELVCVSAATEGRERKIPAASTISAYNKSMKIIYPGIKVMGMDTLIVKDMAKSSRAKAIQTKIKKKH